MKQIRDILLNWLDFQENPFETTAFENVQILVYWSLAVIKQFAFLVPSIGTFGVQSVNLKQEVEFAEILVVK